MHTGEPIGPGAVGRLRQIAKWLGCAAIAVTAAVMLYLTVDHGLRETRSFESPSAVRAATADFRLEQCDYLVIREDVPKGARVFVPGYQLEVRMVDLQTMWSIPVAQPDQAQYILSRGRGALCSRQWLVVRRR